MRAECRALLCISSINERCCCGNKDKTSVKIHSHSRRLVVYWNYSPKWKQLNLNAQKCSFGEVWGMCLCTVLHHIYVCIFDQIRKTTDTFCGSFSLLLLLLLLFYFVVVGSVSWCVGEITSPTKFFLGWFNSRARELSAMSRDEFMWSNEI